MKWVKLMLVELKVILIEKVINFFLHCVFNYTIR